MIRPIDRRTTSALAGNVQAKSPAGAGRASLRLLQKIPGRIRAISPKGTYVVVSAKQNKDKFEVIHTKTGGIVGNFSARGLNQDLCEGVFSPDEKRIFFGLEEETYSLEIGKPPAQLFLNSSRELRGLDLQNNYYLFKDIRKSRDNYFGLHFASHSEFRLLGDDARQSPDGNWIASCDQEHGTIALYNPRTAEPPLTLQVGQKINSFSFRNDGRELLVLSGDKETLFRISVPDLQVIETIKKSGAVEWEQSRDGSLVIFCSGGGAEILTTKLNPLRLLETVDSVGHVGQNWFIWQGQSAGGVVNAWLSFLDPSSGQITKSRPLPFTCVDLGSSGRNFFTSISNPDTGTPAKLFWVGQENFQEIPLPSRSDRLLEHINLQETAGGKYLIFAEADTEFTIYELEHSDPTAAAREAALVRALVTEHDRRWPEVVNGFLNRGVHPGRGSAAGGYDYEGSRPFQPGDRVDEGATARTGKVHGKEYRLEQSRKVMIVVDPHLWADAQSDRSEKARAAIAALAQAELRRHNAVGLVLGNREIFLPATHNDRARLERIIAELAAYQPRDTTADVVTLLSQDVLRRQLPPDSEIFFVSDFSLVDPDKFSAAARRYQRIKVRVTPVKIGSTVEIPEPLLVLLGREYRVVPKLLPLFIARAGQTRPGQIADVLRQHRGLVVSDQVDFSSAAQQVIQQLQQPVRDPGGLLTETAQAVGEQRITIEDTTDQFALDWFDRAIADVTGVEITMLYFTAKVRGWGRLINMLHVWGLEVMNRFLEQGPLFDPELALERLRENDPLRHFIVAYFGDFNILKLHFDIYLSGKFTQEDFLKLLTLGTDRSSPTASAGETEQVFRAAFFSALENQPQWLAQWLQGNHGIPAGLWTTGWGGHYTYFSGFPALADRLSAREAGTFQENKIPGQALPAATDAHRFSPETSGVLSDNLNGSWMELNRALPSEQSYLLRSLGAVFDPTTCTYQPLPQFELSDHQLGGGRQVSGVLTNASEEITDSPAPLGGKTVKTGKKKIRFQLASDLALGATALLDLPLAEFIVQAKEQLGDDSYQHLTAVPELAVIPENLRPKWQQVVAAVQNMTTRQALQTIQAFVVANFSYKKYEGAQAALFREFTNRASRGQAHGEHEYLQVATMLGGGKCQELSIIALDFLRRAGLPALLGYGYSVEGQAVSVQNHAWPNVVVPEINARHSWRALPVEVSRSLLVPSEQAELLAITKSPPTAAEVPSVPTREEVLFTQATEEEKRIMFYQVELELTIAEIKAEHPTWAARMSQPDVRQRVIAMAIKNVTQRPAPTLLDFRRLTDQLKAAGRIFPMHIII